MTALRVLLLKNKTQPTDAYYDTFTHSGHVADFVPLLEHSPVDVSQTVAYLESSEFLHQTERFIITSQRAVEVFCECLDLISQKSPESAAKIRRKVGYTVGPATEQVLSRIGFVDVRGGARAGNALKLADLILDELSSVGSDNAGTIVFFPGVIRKDIIPVKLKANGVSVKEVVIYKTEPKEDIIENFLGRCSTPVDWIVFFSPQGTEDIVEHMVQTSPDVFIASIGPTTEEYLLLKGIAPHVIAAQPTAASLYEGIQRFSSTTT